MEPRWVRTLTLQGPPPPLLRLLACQRYSLLGPQAGLEQLLLLPTWGACRQQAPLLLCLGRGWGVAGGWKWMQCWTSTCSSRSCLLHPLHLPVQLCFGSRQARVRTQVGAEQKGRQ